MIIWGNTIGDISVVTDFNQTDPENPGYLAGRDDLINLVDAAKKAGTDAQTAADNAQTAADNAQTRAENAETNAKNYADGLRKFFTVSVPASGWSGSAPYTQTVAVSGILATDTPHWGVVYSDNAQTALAEKEAFSLVDELDTAANSVTFSCFEEKPTVNLTIQMEVNR